MSPNSRDPGEQFPCSAQHGLKPPQVKASMFLIPWECLKLEPDHKIKLKKPNKQTAQPNTRAPFSSRCDLRKKKQTQTQNPSLRSSRPCLLQTLPWHIHQKKSRWLEESLALPCRCSWSKTISTVKTKVLLGKALSFWAT